MKMRAWTFAFIGYFVLQIAVYWSYYIFGFEKTLLSLIIAIGFYIAIVLITIEENK